MPRASKRKTAPPPNSKPLKSPGKDKSKDTDKIDRLFDLYANSSSGLIEPEGIEALCSDLSVDHTDVRILMFAWKLKAERQGYFTMDEWRTGLKAMKVDGLSKLKKVLPEVEKEVLSNFDDFYAYAFQYCLTEDKQKTVDIETACELWKLVLGSKFPSQVDSLIKYLKIQSDYKVINLDQWLGFLRFCNEISFPDLEKYDATQAWPLILDSFVEWMKQQHS